MAGGQAGTQVLLLWWAAEKVCTSEEHVSRSVGFKRQLEKSWELHGTEGKRR